MFSNLKIRNIILKPFNFAFSRKLKVYNKGKLNADKLFDKFSIGSESEKKHNSNGSKLSRSDERNFSELKGSESIEDKIITREIEKKISKGKSNAEIMEDYIGQEQSSLVEKYGTKNSDEVNTLFPDINLEKLKNAIEAKTARSKKSEIDPEPFDPSKETMFGRNKRRTTMQNKENISERLKNIRIKDDYEQLSDEDEEELISRTTKFSKGGKNKLKHSQVQEGSENEFLSSEEEDTFPMPQSKKKNKKSSTKSTEIGHLNQSTEVLSGSADTGFIDSIPDMNIPEKRKRISQEEDDLRELIKSDVSPLTSEIEKKDELLHDAQKISKVSPASMVALKRSKNKVFEKRALELADMWGMDVFATKHMYYQLRREEKKIVKALLIKKKLEQKQKLKRIAKQWKIENEEILDINYAETLREEETNEELNQDIKIAPNFKNVNEFLFFGDDISYMSNYKRHCRNVLEQLNHFFTSNKNTIRKGLARNVDMIITEVKMNKAQTVIYAWWDLPNLNTLFYDNLSEEDILSVNRKVESNLEKAKPYIAGRLSKQLRFKYAPEIRFLRDSLEKEHSGFLDEISKLNKENGHEQNEEIEIPLEDKILYAWLNNTEAYLQLKKEVDEMQDPTAKEKLSEFLDEPQQMGEKVKQIALNSNNYGETIQKFKKLLNFDDKLIEDLKEGMNNGKIIQNPKTKNEEKAKKKQEKIMAKLKMSENDFAPNKRVDFKSTEDNFLYHFDRRIPGQRNLGFSVEELYSKQKHSEDIDQNISREKKIELRKAKRNSTKATKPKLNKREKSQQFWEKLNDYIY